MAMVQAFSYNFSTVENPLSDGGNFAADTSSPFSPAGVLQVISGNLCETVTTSTTGADYYVGPVTAPGGTWPNDQYAEITIAAYNQGIVLAVRHGTLSNKTMYAFTTTTTTYAFRAYTAGTDHQLATASYTFNVGHVIRFSVAGNVLTATDNGTLIATFTDTNNFVTSGNPGFGMEAVTTVSATQVSLFACGANQSATPTFSPASENFSGSVGVAITSTTAGATIYYTTNGTTPTESSSSVANGGTVTLAASAPLNAIASTTNFLDSTMGSALYNIVPITIFGHN